MTDFDNWLSWYRRTVNPSVNEKLAKMAYDELYFCNCETCLYRKEHGSIPMKLNPACLLPIPAGEVRVG